MSYDVAVADLDADEKPGGGTKETSFKLPQTNSRPPLVGQPSSRLPNLARHVLQSDPQPLNMTPPPHSLPRLEPGVPTHWDGNPVPTLDVSGGVPQTPITSEPKGSSSSFMNGKSSDEEPAKSVIPDVLLSSEVQGRFAFPKEPTWQAWLSRFGLWPRLCITSGCKTNLIDIVIRRIFGSLSRRLDEGKDSHIIKLLPIDVKDFPRAIVALQHELQEHQSGSGRSNLLPLEDRDIYQEFVQRRVDAKRRDGMSGMGHQ